MTKDNGCDLFHLFFLNVPSYSHYDINKMILQTQLYANLNLLNNNKIMYLRIVITQFEKKNRTFFKYFEFGIKLLHFANKNKQ